MIYCSLKVWPYKRDGPCENRHVQCIGTGKGISIICFEDSISQDHVGSDTKKNLFKIAVPKRIQTHLFG